MCSTRLRFQSVGYQFSVCPVPFWKTELEDLCLVIETFRVYYYLATHRPHPSEKAKSIFSTRFSQFISPSGKCEILRIKNHLLFYEEFSLALLPRQRGAFAIPCHHNPLIANIFRYHWATFDGTGSNRQFTALITMLIVRFVFVHIHINLMTAQHTSE